MLSVVGAKVGKFMTSGKKVACHFSILIFLLCFIFLLSLSVGYANSSLLEVCKVFLGKSDATMSFIVTQIRLARILANTQYHLLILYYNNP